MISEHCPTSCLTSNSTKTVLLLLVAGHAVCSAGTSASPETQHTTHSKGWQHRHTPKKPSYLFCGRINRKKNIKLIISKHTNIFLKACPGCIGFQALLTASPGAQLSVMCELTDRTHPSFLHRSASTPPNFCSNKSAARGSVQNTKPLRLCYQSCSEDWCSSSGKKNN